MGTPFPGMDPYLEHPVLWPDVHNRLIAALSDALTPQVAPRYYIALERRVFMLLPNDVIFVGRPDLAVARPRVTDQGSLPSAMQAMRGTPTAVVEVDVPLFDEVGENYLEIRAVTSGDVITIIELLSPANKLYGPGREAYETKRMNVFRTRTNLVEIDLLRAGEPLLLFGSPVQSDYRILVSRGASRPHAQLYAFDLRDPIPVFPLPLRPDDAEPEVDLGTVLHDVYARARFDLQLDYNRPPVPPLAGEKAVWAEALVQGVAGESDSNT